MEKSYKGILANHAARLANEIQQLFNSVPQHVAESEEMELFQQAQQHLTDAFEELTGHSLY